MIQQCTFGGCLNQVEVHGVRAGPLLLELRGRGWNGTLEDVDEDLGLALVADIRCPSHPSGPRREKRGIIQPSPEQMTEILIKQARGER